MKEEENKPAHVALASNLTLPGRPTCRTKTMGARDLPVGERSLGEARLRLCNMAKITLHFLNNKTSARLA